MSQFDTSFEHLENSFAKNNEGLLEHFYKSSDVTSFWIADMDFQIAQPITEELKRLVDRGVFAYEFSTSKLNKAISNWYDSRHKLKLNPQNFVQVPSVLTGISVLIREFSNPGDGILIQTPVYHQFATLIKSANRNIVENPLINTNGFYTMNYEDLELKFKSGKVKMMILCNPHNPIGRVWKKEELTKVLELANKYCIQIISDEIHADVIYKGHQFCSLISLNAQNHFAMLGSTAKTFGMQSISNGFIYIPDTENLKQTKQLVSGMFLDHGSAFTTFATIAAYTKGEAWLEELKIYLAEVLTWITNFTESEMPQIKITPVEGTYQVWIDFSGLGLSKEALIQKLVHDAKLGLAHGDWFDSSGAHDQFARFNFASPLTKIKEAFYQMKKALI